MNAKYIVVKIYVAIFLLAPVASIFSQISHEDSVNYYEYEKMSISLGIDTRGKTMLDFKLKNKAGDLFTCADLRSKITFINFWFETCAPCVAEFQALEKFYNNNKFRENFRFVSITFESDSIIEKIRKKNNLTYPIYSLSSDSCRKLIGRLAYPTTFIVNKNLEIVYVSTGGPTDPKIADKFLNYFIQTELNNQLK
jgi:cytochrome c biogenesis protein CcmG/thiol:disulfide interchange protein DsbE